MFIIEPETNTIKSLEKKSFSELEYRERTYLQEWIAQNPESLGEKLLIIQKEFSGFNETNERLDLLTLDKDGNLVIIENKPDDSGRNLTWQAMKYAAYLSIIKYGNYATEYTVEFDGTQSKYVLIPHGHVSKINSFKGMVSNNIYI